MTIRTLNDATDGQTVTVGSRAYTVSKHDDGRGGSNIMLTGKRGAKYGLMANKSRNDTFDGSRVYFAIDCRGFGLAAALKGVHFIVREDGTIEGI